MIIGVGIVEEFEIVKHARALLASMPESLASEKTKAGYTRQFARLLMAGGSIEGVITSAKDTQKIATWFSRKAAVTHGAREMIVGILAAQDLLQRDLRGVPTDDSRWLGWRAKIKALKRFSRLLDAISKEEAIPIEGRKNRHAKRVDMKGLPDDWRERIVERLPKYRQAVLVAAVTGCRPSELVGGVQLSIEGGMLIATIRGAKTTAKTGQPTRKLWWPPDCESPLVKALIKIVLEGQVVEGLEVRIKDARAFSGAVRAAGMREWSGRRSSITPYCFRHQAASDMKGSGTLSSGDISAALGHCSDVTKTTYGHRGMASGRSVCPVRVEAARPVRVAPQSKAAVATARAQAKSSPAISPKPII